MSDRTQTDFGSSADDIKAAYKPIKQATHVPGFIYSSPEIFALEKERIFMKDWLCLGRVEEIEKPGDYMTFRILGEPVLICRDEKGNINAFANMCRHRGVEVAQARGNTTEFTCPYHGWLYNLEGWLVGAPYMRDAEGFDIRSCRLRPVRSGVWAGWIFINLDDNAEPFEKTIADFDSEFSFLQQERYRIADRYEAEFDCNWKLLVENFVDFYHIGVLHANSFGRFMKTMDVAYDLRDRGGVFLNYDAGTQSQSGKLLFGKPEWLKDKPDRFSATGWLSPNFHMFARAENVRPYFVWPISPTKSRVSVITILPEESFSHPRFAENIANYRQQLITVSEEDRSMVESLQNAMASRKFVPGRMSRLEQGVQHILKYNVSRIMDRLT